jgi:hypothetical protein
MRHEGGVRVVACAHSPTFCEKRKARGTKDE